MNSIPQKVVQLTMLTIVLCILFSCSKDTDLLLDSVLNDPNVSIQEKDGVITNEEDLVSRSFAFSPINDAYMQGEYGHDKSIIRLQEDYRTSYLMFDLSAVNGPITDVVLQFSIDSDEGDGSINIHKGSSTDWSEENLSITNVPGLAVQLGSMNKDYKVGSPEKISLNSNDLQAELTTLVLTHSSGNDLAFASKEHPENKGPKLIVSYKAPAGSPLIEEEEEEDTTQEEDTSQEEEEQDNTASTEGAYYVTTNGKASNDGLSEATAWSIEAAFENAVAGDVVYVKAGNYGNKELIVDNSGTSQKPIKFIGYTNSPGDLVSGQKSTFSYGDQLDATKMPLLIGNAPNNEGEGTGITATENYITIENFQITKFKTGIRSNGTQIKLKNIIVTQMGDFNPSHTYPTATNNKLLNYSGTGIVFSGNNSELHNSFVLNCGAQAITFNHGNGLIAKNNTVYSNSQVNPTDYYFLIAQETKNSTFLNTKVFRVGELEHHGHGIVLKGNGNITGNLIDGFEITNTFLELQFPNTSNNTVRNGTIVKEPNVNNDTDTVGGLKVANGSHHNTFKNIELTNCSILFQDWNDGLAGDVNDASDNNTFEEITVRDAHSAIAFSFFHVTNSSSSADNNTFINCDFNNLKYLYERDRANTGTKLINCSINNVEYLAQKRIANGPNYNINATYQSCTWSGNNFTTPN